MSNVSTAEEITVAMDWAEAHGKMGYPVRLGQTIVARTPMLYYAGEVRRVGPLGFELSANAAEIVYDIGRAANVHGREWASAETHDGVIRLPWSGLLCAEEIAPPDPNLEIANPNLYYLAEPGELVIARTPMLYYTGRVSQNGPMGFELVSDPAKDNLRIVYDVGNAKNITRQEWKNASSHRGPFSICWHSILSVQVIVE